MLPETGEQCRHMGLLIVLGLAFAFGLHPQEKDGITIDADPGVRSEPLRAYYFLTGEFGGYGDFTGTPFLRVHYEGQRARSLKAVAYVKGCELVTITLDPLPPGPSRVRFECRKLRTIKLTGFVTGHQRPSEIKVQVQYLANWSHAFFGILDGATLSLPIGEVTPEPDGSFAIDVPDFAGEEAEWVFNATLPVAHPSVPATQSVRVPVSPERRSKQSTSPAPPHVILRLPSM